MNLDLNHPPLFFNPEFSSAKQLPLLRLFGFNLNPESGDDLDLNDQTFNPLEALTNYNTLLMEKPLIHWKCRFSSNLEKPLMGLFIFAPKIWIKKYTPFILIQNFSQKPFSLLNGKTAIKVNNHY